ALELLARVGLDDPAGQARAFPHQLSGGQRQRVMLAIALACAPALVLADEPTTALDVTVQAQVLGVLSALVAEEGSALVLISHDLAVVSEHCERLVVMYGGTVVECGPTAELLARPRHPYTAGLVATAVAVSPDRPRDGRPLATIRGSVPELGRFPSGCVFRSRCGRAGERCVAAPALVPTPPTAGSRPATVGGGGGDGGAGAGGGGARGGGAEGAGDGGRGGGAGAGAGAGERSVACWHPLGDPGAVEAAP
ncbi:MAG TPA: ABC transporter ATP-binding protein, partial [Acidimicrobiales bacterium]|nr:ABC transporter ATP-binding protein [Acidimicrobiales bacterium]